MCKQPRKSEDFFWQVIKKSMGTFVYKATNLSFPGVIRSMCVDGSGTWIAAGFSSGIFSAIDVRAGILRGQARIHDGEILQVIFFF